MNLHESDLRYVVVVSGAATATADAAAVDDISLTSNHSIRNRVE